MKVFKKIASFAMALAIAVTAFLATPAITAEAAGSVAIGGVLISDGNVVVSSKGTASSDDGLYHLIASDVNQAASVGIDVAQSPVSAAASFAAPLGYNTEASLLFKKFTVCVVSGGALKPVSNSMYITNPEALGSTKIARTENGKKGLLADASSSNMGMRTLAQLGAKQATVTIELSRISNGRGTPYVYNGKSYNFNTAFISAYDNLIGRLSAQGVQVSMIIVCDQAAPGFFMSPYAADGIGQHTYYGLNATTTEGAETLAAAASFLANRYSGFSLFGMTAKVDNFIIGNEVNAWRQWNYMNCGNNLAVYTQEYANAFRLCYNAIKSVNANANVYTCIDHSWNASASGLHSSRSFLTQFNNCIASQGNIDWRLAFHAYNYPLTNNMAWAPTDKIQRNQNTKYISVYNIDVLTDFLSQPAFLSPTGAVRTVKLSEQGYTSSAGQEAQAVSIVYAIMVANNNSHIDGIILAREKDDPHIEMPQGLANGLLDYSNHAKVSYEMYKNAESPETIAKASSMAGVDLNTLLAPR